MGVARLLLEAGADVETPDNYGQTPFFMACWKGIVSYESEQLLYKQSTFTFFVNESLYGKRIETSMQNNTLCTAYDS